IIDLYNQDAITAIVCDECHTVSCWGQDFRPAYALVGILRDWAPDVPILALTATASERVRKDVTDILRLNDPFVIVGNFDRPNLYLSILPTKKDVNKDIGHLLNKFKNNRMIIYCKTRDDTD